MVNWFTVSATLACGKILTTKLTSVKIVTTKVLNQALKQITFVDNMHYFIDNNIEDVKKEDNNIDWTCYFNDQIMKQRENKQFEIWCFLVIHPNSVNNTSGLNIFFNTNRSIRILYIFIRERLFFCLDLELQVYAQV